MSSYEGMDGARLFRRQRLVAGASARIEELAEIFKVLADPTRLRILTELAGEPGLCVHEICRRVEASQTAVSHQLRILRGARLVRGRRSGKEIIYALDDEHVLGLLSEGAKHDAHRSKGR